jgi:hypothetical protein
MYESLWNTRAVPKISSQQRGRLSKSFHRDMGISSLRRMEGEIMERDLTAGLMVTSLFIATLFVMKMLGW